MIWSPIRSSGLSSLSASEVAKNVFVIQTGTTVQLDETSPHLVDIIPSANMEVELPVLGATPWAFVISHAGNQHEIQLVRNSIDGGGSVGLPLVPGVEASVRWNGVALFY